MPDEGVVPPVGDNVTRLESRYIANRLKFYFATLSCLGGLVLGAGNETETIPVIAVFFAVFGYIFVDWLELFALPPVGAYAAMAVAAFYCVSDFSDLDSPGNRQMVAVAQLLVFVQAILMLQRKSRRIFEQLGVFCLLELIVAAVFNNAINYGLMLIPIAIIGAWALSLLSAVSTWDGLQDPMGLEPPKNAANRRSKKPPAISVCSPQSLRSIAMSASRLPRVAFLTVAPSVALVGMIFFYALPRTADATRMEGSGNALVGFADQLRLEQLGQMAKNSTPALRIQTHQQGANRPYQVIGGLYLRGRVLEKYQTRVLPRPSGLWSSVRTLAGSGLHRLPSEYYPPRPSDRNFYDSVVIDVTCESMRTPSLFAIAPYHRRNSNTDVLHNADLWTLSRRTDEESFHPRLNYSFGSHAFRGGMQSELIAREPLQNANSIPEAKRRRDYDDYLLDYDIDLVPSAARLAKGVAAALEKGDPGGSINQFRLSKSLEQYLAVEGGFGYTLDLSANEIPGLDPIEQFLRVDRKGHCQFFASSLVMMLRSQGIPSRIVVGYRTDEYNDLGQYYVARQSHAHAWVEALVPRSDLPQNRTVYGQRPSEQYWLRLDPTPGGISNDSASGGVGQVFDLAQNIWDDYVVEMDATRQDDTLLGTPGMNPMSGSYQRMIEALSQRLARIRAGELGGGSLASRTFFSWPAAILGVVMTLVTVLILKIRAPGWIRSTMRGKMFRADEVTPVTFYAETLHQMSRLGLTRAASQTPAEFAVHAEESLGPSGREQIATPLALLTDAFYRARFGSEGDSAVQTADSQIRHALTQLTGAVDQLTSSATMTERHP